MQKIILVLAFLIMFPSICWGEWVKSVTSDKGNTYYIEYDTITKKGNHIYFWFLEDFNKKKDEYGDMSVLTHHKLDCQLFRMKILQFITFDQPMGTGKITHEAVPPNTWRDMPENTYVFYVHKEVCYYMNQ